MHLGVMGGCLCNMQMSRSGNVDRCPTKIIARDALQTPNSVYNALLFRRGYSSAGRALAWHARGQRFDPAYLHQAREKAVQSSKKAASSKTRSPSSRGLGHYPFTVGTGVRIPVGTPALCWQCKSGRRSAGTNTGVVVQLVRIPACHAGGRGFESRPLRQN